MAKLMAKEQLHPFFLDEILAETEDRFEAMATILR